MIICADFDGTIAQNDVGSLLARSFGDPAVCERRVAAWKRGAISSRQCQEQELATMRVTPAARAEFCAQQPLTPGFVEFVAFCRARHWPLIVLSDGFDVYIRQILARHGLELPFVCNHLRFLPPDRVAAEFPYWQYSCGRCGNCKGYPVRRLRRPGEEVVYIGDGYSDRCGAAAAGVIFAKHDLAEWCRQNGTACHAYDDFHAIARMLAQQS
ncbi:MAG: MtnX-like HAD-IB family phosphatase [candidate division KSB1 bacterium]|nr:MtnX-like HAD-IB family phosphatase [candidate division KSB1 bacterium]MDZ7274960.1 MtnX-like HAD-IB family phosphatase [candidate division KSB1 bacterium]MDZ7286589.1 MtnX-like HAD-IB family phosphatase [candidate division KSB1 bacterium]MDZ7299247.1 MtnX-like HAD-IB family phosphatase [candidate division KSB1 bacterium]MDZ7308896.1 MtnX-like HAD-IB family phosphatase [candidate division KSB1 bacterium]